MQEKPHGGHNDVLHQRRDDFPERCSDDDANCEIDDIAAHGELFEFLEHEGVPLRVLVGPAAGRWVAWIISGKNGKPEEKRFLKQSAWPQDQHGPYQAARSEE